MSIEMNLLGDLRRVVLRLTQVWLLVTRFKFSHSACDSAVAFNELASIQLVRPVLQICEAFFLC